MARSKRIDYDAFQRRATRAERMAATLMFSSQVSTPRPVRYAGKTPEEVRAEVAKESAEANRLTLEVLNAQS